MSRQEERRSDRREMYLFMMTLTYRELLLDEEL
jgi:hypothetical protein